MRWAATLCVAVSCTPLPPAPIAHTVVAVAADTPAPRATDRWRTPVTAADWQSAAAHTVTMGALDVAAAQLERAHEVEPTAESALEAARAWLAARRYDDAERMLEVARTLGSTSDLQVPSERSSGHLSWSSWTHLVMYAEKPPKTFLEHYRDGNTREEQYRFGVAWAALGEHVNAERAFAFARAMGPPQRVQSLSRALHGRLERLDGAIHEQWLAVIRSNADDTGMLEVRSLATGRVWQRWEVADPRAVGWLDSVTIVVAQGGHVHQRNALTGEPKLSWALPAYKAGDPVRIRTSPSGRFITMTPTATHAWDSLGTMLHAHGAATAAALSPHARRFAAGNRDGTIDVVELTGPAKTRRLALPAIVTNPVMVEDLAFQDEDTLSVSFGWDGPVVSLDVTTGALRHRPSSRCVHHCRQRLSPNGKNVATTNTSYGGAGEITRTSELWDIATGAELAKLDDFDLAIPSDDGALAVIDGHLGGVAKYDNVERRWQAAYRPGSTIVDVSADGRTAAFHHQETVDVIDLVDHTTRLTIHNAYEGARLSTDGKRIATPHLHHTDVHDISTGKRVGRLKHAAIAAVLQWSPDGHTLALGVGWDVHLWHVNNNHRRKFTGHKGLIGSLAFDAAGYRLVSASRRAFVWDVPNSKFVFGIDRDIWSGRAVLSPDGAAIAIETQSGLAVHDVGTLTPRFELANVRDFAFLSDDRLLVRTDSELLAVVLPSGRVDDTLPFPDAEHRMRIGDETTLLFSGGRVEVLRHRDWSLAASLISTDIHDWHAVAASGAVDATPHARDQLVAVESHEGIVRDGRLLWHARHVPALMPRIVTGAIVRPPLP